MGKRNKTGGLLQTRHIYRHMIKLKSWREPVKNTKVFDDVSGSYLVWNEIKNHHHHHHHHHTTTIKFENVKAYKRGEWYLSELPNRSKIKKGKNTRGFRLFDKINPFNT